jgi:hypothetical protein
MAFLFVWQFILSGPLEIASGYIGFLQYLGYIWPARRRACCSASRRRRLAEHRLLYRGSRRSRDHRQPLDRARC